MLRLNVLLALVSISYGFVVSLNEVKQAFEKFKSDHGVVYADAKEEAHRLEIFAGNLAKIKAHNQRANNGEYLYWLGVNKFADLSYDEVAAKYLGLKKTSSLKQAPIVHQYTGNDLPTSFDWRDKGAITGVKDQGDCGSCWAFAAVAAIESANFLKNGKLVSLSEQNLVDCDRASEDEGCNGGWTWDAFEYVISNKGIDTESSYPYKGIDDKCSYSPSKVGATISSYANITSGDEKALQSAVVKQPITVSIDANDALFYEGGIISAGVTCSSKFEDINHAVTVVGYGTEGSTDYWIIKNSWGESYGEKGYFRLQRGLNLCGVATAASYPIV